MTALVHGLRHPGSLLIDQPGWLASRGPGAACRQSRRRYLGELEDKVQELEIIRLELKQHRQVTLLYILRGIPDTIRRWSCGNIPGTR
jgi:hypothetical protein